MVLAAGPIHARLVSRPSNPCKPGPMRMRCDRHHQKIAESMEWFPAQAQDPDPIHGDRLPDHEQALIIYKQALVSLRSVAANPLKWTPTTSNTWPTGRPPTLAAEPPWKYATSSPDSGAPLVPLTPPANGPVA